MTRLIAFVEEKCPDFERVGALLRESAKINRWTNFGPVWHRLKEYIEAALALPPDRCAVPSASGTHALFAAAALATRNEARRWLVSSYGFRVTVVGPFAGAETVDCDKSGLIDIAKINPRLTDKTVILATNPFGLLGSMDPVVEVARRTNSPLIIDNAAGFVGFDRQDHAGIFECISFHHTKPFGFGEGGCLIVDRVLETDAKNAMDFGYRWKWSGGQEALSNGKLSEPAAAFILARHETSEQWMPGYREQFWRILDIAERVGFRLLVDRECLGRGVYGNVPLVASVLVPPEAIQNETLALGKYYKPLGGGPVGRELYQSIVNFPSHSGIAAMEDHDIAELLTSIRGRALVLQSRSGLADRR